MTLQSVVEQAGTNPRPGGNSAVNLIHVGLAKAASTTLQNTVFAAQQHFAYVGKSRNRELDQPVQELIDRICFQDSLDYDAAAAASLLRSIRQSMAAQTRPLLLSHEVLSGEGRADRRLIAERLHQLFAPAKILLVIRRQTSMLQSQYMNYRRVPGARIGSFEGWLDEFYGGARFPDNFRSPLNYEPLVRTYDDVFGREDVVVLPFELIQDEGGFWVQKLSDLLHMQRPVVAECLDERLYNPRQSQRYSAVLRLQSLFGGANLALLGRRLMPQFIYEPARRFVTGGRLITPPEFSERWAKRIFDLCAQGNAQLEARIGLPLGALGYPVPSQPLAAK